MKEILAALKRDEDVVIGKVAVLHRMSDGSICIRVNHSGLTTESQRPSLRGVRHLLDWLDCLRSQGALDRFVEPPTP